MLSYFMSTLAFILDNINRLSRLLIFFSAVKVLAFSSEAQLLIDGHAVRQVVRSHKTDSSRSVISGKRERERETWLWNGEVQRAGEEEKRVFKFLHRTSIEENRGA